MAAERFFTALHDKDAWAKTDKRGYKHQENAENNAEIMSRRSGGQLVGVLYCGKIISTFLNGEKSEYFSSEKTEPAA